MIIVKLTALRKPTNPQNQGLTARAGDDMHYRRNEFDVTDSVNTTEPAEVARQVSAIFENLYQHDAAPQIARAFSDVERLYKGEYPGYKACDTDYHDIQHVLDVTLAMARLMDGFVRKDGEGRVIDERLFCFGVVSALLHDCGYIRRENDTRHGHGAEYTKTHVSRGARFIKDYFRTIGMPDFAIPGARTVHYTGYEVPVAKINVDPQFKIMGRLLGSADILAQMADRCYLEKCYERLYPEFVHGGIDRKRNPDGTEQVMFASPEDLIFKTPGFYQGATKRLEQDLGGYYGYFERHFGGHNLYLAELEKNINYARAIARERDIGMLRRKPPVTIGDGNGGSGGSEAGSESGRN